MSLVSLAGVVKEFDGVRAVDHITFSIDRGEIVGFLGPNGAGKTTAMRLITGILEADAGTVEIAGRSIEEDPREARRRIGYLPETNPLYPDMPVREYLEFIVRIRELDARTGARRIEAAVSQTGIGDVFQRPIEQLSKGYRQRVGLAQAILAEPEILILDEPTEGLDPNQRVEIRRLIGELGSERTVLLSTHVLQEVQLTCNRAIIIHRGRIIADGSVEELAARGGRGARVSVEISGAPKDALTTLSSLPAVAAVEPIGTPAGGRLRCVVTGVADRDPRPEIFRAAAEGGWELWELHLERESLEDLFRELTAPEPGEER